MAMEMESSDLEKVKRLAQDEWWTQAPATTAKRTNITPMVEASPTLFFRQTSIYRPMPMAMGIVRKIVKVPQALSARALTTTMAKPAKAVITINRMAAKVTPP